MRTQLTLVAASLAALLMASAAHAAPPPVTNDLSVTATILPSACAISIANNGVYDYGDINSSDLNSSNMNELGEIRHLARITCASPTALQWGMTDNRGPLPPSNEPSLDPYLYGLGLDSSGNQIGASMYGAAVVTADGVQALLIESLDSGTTWKISGSAFARDQRVYSLASTTNRTTPLPVQQVEFELRASATIAPSSTLDLTKLINIDGSATLELTYI
jgi:hypothetical protein